MTAATAIESVLQCKDCRDHLVRLRRLASKVSRGSDSSEPQWRAARSDYGDEARRYLDHLARDHGVASAEGGDAA